MQTEQQKADFGFRLATNKEIAEAYVRKALGLSEDEELHLEHWLRVLETKSELVLMNTGTGVCIIKGIGDVNFNLATGQPATEADYRAFNDIVNN